MKYGDFVSTTAPITCGVLQGSVIGPVLFSLYVLPLGSCLTICLPMIHKFIIYLGPWSAYCNDQIRNLGVVFEPEVKFYKQINAVVKSCFSRLLD